MTTEEVMQMTPEQQNEAIAKAGRMVRENLDAMNGQRNDDQRWLDEKLKAPACGVQESAAACDILILKSMWRQEEVLSNMWVMVLASSGITVPKPCLAEGE